MRIILDKQDFNYAGQTQYEEGKLEDITIDSFSLRMDAVFNAHYIEFIDGDFAKVLKETNGLRETYVFT